MGDQPGECTQPSLRELLLPTHGPIPIGPPHIRDPVDAGGWTSAMIAPVRAPAEGADGSSGTRSVWLPNALQGPTSCTAPGATAGHDEEDRRRAAITVQAGWGHRHAAVRACAGRDIHRRPPSSGLSHQPLDLRAPVSRFHPARSDSSASPASIPPASTSTSGTRS